MLLAATAIQCPHRSCFATHAYVPAGIICDDCGLLILQFIPQSPAQIGYVSADWAWHHEEGKPWTTQEIIAVREHTHP